MFGGNLPEFSDFVDVERIHVNVPDSLVFLCGGLIGHADQSFRKTFLSFCAEPPFDKYKFLIAEELNGFFPLGTYKNLLRLESDLAQISSLIIIFSESYGSVAEIGAFSMSTEISARLLVVIDDENWEAKSFIKLGPLKSLIDQERTSVYTLTRSELGFRSVQDLSGLNVYSFKTAMNEAISQREATIPKISTFDRSRTGHLIMFMTGLVQLHGAMTSSEIKD